MIVAGFAGQAALLQAATRLRQAGLPVETRTPVALPADEHGPSWIPLVILAAALLAAFGSFAMQCYATMFSYPQLIGGRPNYFWTSFIVYSFECGVLAATLTGFVAFIASNRLPRYWEPSDECDRLRAATRDGWFLVADGEQARVLLADCHPSSLEQVSSDMQGSE